MVISLPQATEFAGRSTTLQSLRRTAGVTPDLRLPSQSQNSATYALTGTHLQSRGG